VIRTLRFLKERFGDEGLRETLASLDTADRQALEGRARLGPGSAAAAAATDEAGGGPLRKGGPAHLPRDRAASADYGLNTVYKIFFKIGSPQFIIARASRVFQQLLPTGKHGRHGDGPGL